MLIAPDTSPREPRLPGDADQLGLRLFGRVLSSTPRRHRGRKTIGCTVMSRGNCRRSWPRNLPAAPGATRHFRSLHGRPRRVDAARCAIRRPLQVGIGVCADRRADAIARGARRRLPIIWARTLEAWREYDATRIGGAPAVSRAHPHRSRHRRINILAAATLAGEIRGRGGQVRPAAEPAHAAGLRSRLLLHSDFHGGPSAPPRAAACEIALTGLPIIEYDSATRKVPARDLNWNAV